MPGYSLELETIKRLGKMLKAYEGGTFTPTQRQHITDDYGPPVEPGIFILNVTGGLNGSFYPANLVEYINGSWNTITQVRVFELNGRGLGQRRYFGRCVGNTTVSGTTYELFAVYSPGPIVYDISCNDGVQTVSKTNG